MFPMPRKEMPNPSPRQRHPERSEPERARVSRLKAIKECSQTLTWLAVPVMEGGLKVLGYTSDAAQEVKDRYV